MTQKEAIKRYILSNKDGITPDIAINEFGCYRLADVVWKLKQEGMHIITVSTPSRSRYGRKIHFACYKLGD